MTRQLPPRRRDPIKSGGKPNNNGSSRRINPISVGNKLNNKDSTITRPELINYIRNRAVAAFNIRYPNNRNNFNLNRLRNMYSNQGLNMNEFNYLVNFMGRENYNNVNIGILRKIAIALKAAANLTNARNNMGQVRNAMSFLTAPR